MVAVTACAFGVAGVLAWPIGAAVRRATEDDYLTGQSVGSFLSRADATWHAMTAQLHLAVLALAIGIVAALVLIRCATRIGLRIRRMDLGPRRRRGARYRRGLCRRDQSGELLA